jgi:amino acid transporter
MLKVTAPEVAPVGPFGRPMPTPVYYGLAISSVGGPLALVTLFLPNTLVGVRSAAGLAVLLGAVAFVCPAIAWYRYAGAVASSGGLYSFVEAAAGTNVARLHGTVIDPGPDAAPLACRYPQLLLLLAVVAAAVALADGWATYQTFW